MDPDTLNNPSSEVLFEDVEVKKVLSSGLFFMNFFAFPEKFAMLSWQGLMRLNQNITLLTSSNWETCKHKVKILLLHYGTWEFVEEPVDVESDLNMTPVVEKLVP